MLLGREGVEDHAAFCFADALDDDLLGRLRGDAAEVLRLHVDVYKVAQLRGLADLAGRVERNFRGGVITSSTTSFCTYICISLSF